MIMNKYIANILKPWLIMARVKWKNMHMFCKHRENSVLSRCFTNRPMHAYRVLLRYDYHQCSWDFVWLQIYVSYKRNIDKIFLNNFSSWLTWLTRQWCRPMCWLTNAAFVELLRSYIRTHMQAHSVTAACCGVESISSRPRCDPYLRASFDFSLNT